MENTTLGGGNLSLGKKVERIRKYRGIKQEYVAQRLSLSQQQYSKIEQQDEIEENLLAQIAEILGVTPEAIKNFDDERIIYYINSTHLHDFKIEVHDNTMTDNALGSINGQQFNSKEVISELIDRLVQSQIELNSFKNRKDS